MLVWNNFKKSIKRKMENIGKKEQTREYKS